MAIVPHAPITQQAPIRREYGSSVSVENHPPPAGAQLRPLFTGKGHGKTVYIDDLSSGEKQIVFRGGFVLKDTIFEKQPIVIIDEPEISLHPDWQIKILDFYKQLVTDESGSQQCQLFVVTHSPFIIHI